MLHKSSLQSYKNPSKKIHQGNPKSQPLLYPFIQLYYFIISAGALPLRIMTRRNFGERSIPIFTLILFIGAYFYYLYQIYTLMIFGGAYLMLSAFFETSYINQMIEISEYKWLYLILLIVVNGFTLLIFNMVAKTISHYKSIIRNGQFHKSKSSEYRGDSFKFLHLLGTKFKTPLGVFTVDYNFLQMVVEPAKFFKGGLKLSFWSCVISFWILIFKPPLFFVYLAVTIFSFTGLGIILSLSAICLFLEEFALRQRIRDSALDLLDAEKDMKTALKIRDKILQVEEPVNLKSNTIKEFPLVKIS